METVAGLHLDQHLPPRPDRPSALAVITATGQLQRLATFHHTEEIAAILEGVDGPVVVDAPLAVPGARGQRDVERVMAWCDAPCFPVAATRLTRLYGGLRGPTFAAAAGRDDLWETSTDLLLRLLVWEKSEPPDTARMDLGAYRARWAALRPLGHRPGRDGRGGGPARRRALGLLATHLDLGDWLPDEDDPAAAAAAVDALCCALVALRARGHDGRAVAVGTPELGRMLVPVDPHLARRLALTLARLRAEGAIAI